MRAFANLIRDLRFGARLVRRSPTFAVLVVLTLGVAVGANVTVYTLVKAIWFEPRPVADPDRVVIVAQDRLGEFVDSVDRVQLDDLRRAPVFDGVAGQVADSGLWADFSPRLRLSAVGRPIEPVAVTANYFGVLGLTIRGRDFAEADDQSGAPAVAIISDRLWRTAFDGRSEIIGRAFETGTEPIRIIGVAPAGFRGARLGERVDIWIPRRLTPRFSPLAHVPDLRASRTESSVVAIARLRGGISVFDAQMSLRPPPASQFRLLSLSEVIGVPGRVTTPLGERDVLPLVAAMALLVLFTGCATLAALMLVHLEHRRRELLVRLALGSGHARLVRQVLAEVALLAFAGSGAAFVLTVWLLAASRTLSLAAGLSLDRLDLSLDWTVVSVGLLIGIGTMVMAALVALGSFGRNTFVASLTNAASTPTKSSLRLRRGLLALHVAATVVLMVCGALFVRTITYGFTTGAGFDVAHTLFVAVQPSFAEFWEPTTRLVGPADKPLRQAAFSRLMDQLRELPGVRAVAVGDSLVRSDELGASAAGGLTSVWTAETSTGPRRIAIVAHVGGSGYLDALGIPIIAGELPDGNGVFISRSLAAQVWPRGDALGRTIQLGRAADYRITGIVADFVQGSISSDVLGGAIVIRRGHGPESVGTTGIPVVVATTVDAATLAPAAEQIVAGVFPNAARTRVATGRTLLEMDLARERLGASFFAGFGLVSLILGVASVFGLVAYLVESSSRDLGVRLALGATPRNLMRLVMATSLTPVVLGAIAGLVTAALLSGTIGALLHGTSPLDAVSYAGPVAVMLLGASASAFLAAMRVRRLTPMEAITAQR